MSLNPYLYFDGQCEPVRSKKKKARRQSPAGQDSQKTRLVKLQKALSSGATFDALETIGATRTLTALRGLQKSVGRAVPEGRTRMDASEFVSQLPDTREHDRKPQAYVDEMEQKLLGFCKAHVQELASG